MPETHADPSGPYRGDDPLDRRIGTAEHHRAATPIQRMVDRLTAYVGRPRFIGVLTVGATLWIVANAAAPLVGLTPLDPPPFAWLDGAVSLGALYIALLILTTQRRQDQLAQHREQLTLELTILSEQKTAKIIQLLEEARRDDPHLRNRIDEEGRRDGRSRPIRSRCSTQSKKPMPRPSLLDSAGEPVRIPDKTRG